MKDMSLNFNGFDPIAAVNYKAGVNPNALETNALFKHLGLQQTPGRALNFQTPIKVNCAQPMQILLVGCGGTGSHLLPNILQYLWAAAKGNISAMPEVILVDPDILEVKNLVRQRFTKADVGMSKAEALARRYSGAFGVRLRVYDKYISSQADMTAIFDNPSTPDAPGITAALKTRIVIGAVDNHRARMVIWQWMNGIADRAHAGNKYWIDAGNETWHGQVIMGFKASTATNNNTDLPLWKDAKLKADKTPAYIKPVDLPGYFEHYPDEFVKIKDTPVTPQNHCAAMVEENPQTIQANMMSAFCATSLFVQAHSGELRTNAIHFDCITGNTASALVTKDNLVSWASMTETNRNKILELLSAELNADPVKAKAALSKMPEWKFLSEDVRRNDILL